jgi:hypothetical protein
VQNMGVAAKSIVGYYSEKALLEKLIAVLGDKSRSPDEAKESFLKVLQENPDHDEALGLLAFALQINSADETIKQIDKELPYIQARPVVWQPISWADAGLYNWGFSLGRVIITISHNKNIARAAANEKLAILISRFDRANLAKLATLAVQEMLTEIDRLGSFLSESDKLIREQVRPRLVVDSSAFNSSRSPVTVAPQAVLRVTAANGVRFDVPLAMRAIDVTPQQDGDLDMVAGNAESAKTVKYATVESGKLARIRWIGEFSGSLEQWGTLAKAFQSGTLACELTVQTPDGLISRSAEAPFGGIRRTSDADAVVLANKKAD